MGEPGTRRPRPAWLVLLVVVTTQLIIGLDATVVNVALPRIRSSLHFSTSSLSWVFDAYTLAYAGLLLLGGRSGDIFGRRRVLAAGIALFTVASVVAGFAVAPWMLLAARAVQGVGAAFAGPGTLSMITVTYREGPARNRALAIFSMSISSAFAVGLLLGGALTDAFGWRAVFFVTVPIGAVMMYLIPTVLPESDRHPGHLDVPAALMSTFAIGGLAFSFIHASEHGWGTLATLGPLVGGLLLLGAFFGSERRSAQPLLPLEVFADRNRAVAYTCMACFPAGNLGMIFFLTQYFQRVRDYSPLHTGLAFLPMALLMASMTRITPRLLARAGVLPMVLAGSGSITAALLLLTRLSLRSDYWTTAFPSMVLLGVGLGLAFLPLNTVILSGVPARVAGVAAGTLQVMQNVGITLGLAIFVTIYGAIGVGAGDAAGVLHATRYTFLIGAVFPFTGFLLSAALLRVPRPAAVPTPVPVGIVEAS
ncbi:MAG TPA: MFS transporter [Mycobacteriales bacterium]|nr:MFS transporter [Mycobacteriales bacterium]